jgi:hypothetical protein
MQVFRGAEIADRLLEPHFVWSNGVDRAAAPGTAWYRMERGLPEIATHSELRISAEDRVFVIGSCFGRLFEEHLARAGFAVPSADVRFHDLQVRHPMYHARNFSNRYVPASVAPELLWALDPSPSSLEQCLCELPNGDWDDPYVASVYPAGPKDEVIERHLELTRAMAEVFRCRIVVVILGLVEAFFDTATGLYTNVMPDPSCAFGGRYELHVLGVEETSAQFDALEALLAVHGAPRTEIVVMVDPSPMVATFSGEDVVAADTFGKATLRVAAEQWSRRSERVHYFPGFEIVSRSVRPDIWLSDGRHLETPVIGEIADQFIRAFEAGDVSPDVGAPFEPEGRLSMPVPS